MAPAKLQIREYKIHEHHLGFAANSRLNEWKGGKPFRNDEHIRRVTIHCMLACRDISFLYGQKTILSEISLEIPPGESVCIISKSGGGKSLLLRLLLGLHTPTSGRIEVDGVDLALLPPAVLQLFRGRIGTIFQEPQLLSRMTVLENVAYPLEIRGERSASSTKAAKDMLLTLGLGGNEDALPASCSVSQRMMACIGRALIANPMIVLADEPFAPLDETQRGIALSMLKAAHARGASLLIFTQDASLAKHVDARVIHLENGNTESVPKTSKVRHSPKEEDASHQLLHSPTAPAEVSAKHKPLDEEEVAVPIRSKKAPADEPQTSTAPAKQKRRIKITSIGS